MMVHVYRACKDCNARVEKGREGDKFPYGCPNCGNKTKDRTKKVTEPARTCLSCKDLVESLGDGSFYCQNCGTTEKEQTKASKSARREQTSASLITNDMAIDEPFNTITLSEAKKIFDAWWQQGVLKAELKPEKVLKIIYVMVEENRYEVRVKIVALCKLANGKKRRMVARRYQQRGATSPSNVIVTTTKKPDGDELFDDSPVGRDTFARRLLDDLETRRAEAARWLLEHADEVKKGKKR